MRVHSRKTAWTLVLFALLFVLASAFFPAFSCHHDCTGHDCPVCMQIRVWTDMLRLFGAGVVCALLFLSCQIAAKHFALAFSDLFLMRTPVALKTKLLN